jgi:hypothetical protein
MGVCVAEHLKLGRLVATQIPAGLAKQFLENLFF